METQQEAELDLIGLFLHLKRKLWLIILVTVLAGIVGYVGSEMLTTPLYTATTQVYVYQQDKVDAVDYNNLVVASQLRRDCAVIIRDESVTREVVERLKLPVNPKALGQAIRVDTEENTRILKISYTDINAARATKIVNTVREVAAERTKELMNSDVLRTLYEATLPQAEITTNSRRSTMVAAAVGAVGIISLLVIFFLMDDTIRTEDDVQIHLGLCTLAVIPLSNELQDNRGKRSGSSGRKLVKRKLRR